jgi:integrase
MLDVETASTNRVHVQGFGTLLRRGRIWWIRYSYLSQRREESSKSDNQRKAEQLLRQRIQECGKGRRIDPTAEHRVRMEELFTALEKDYENNQRRSKDSLPFRLKPLREAFGTAKALDVNAARIARYVSDRLAAGMARATVNRELAALKRSMSLAVEQERLSSVPKIKMLTEATPRQGFVKPADFEAIVAHLPVHLQDFARFGYVTGTRRGEIAKLAWSDVDREGQRITFRREHAKNGQPRVIPFVGELAEIMARRWKAREYKAPGGPGMAELVFHRKGRPIVDLRKRWGKACQAAKLPGLIFHDLRRSAVRNLVSAGVDQTVAMKITGHRTVSVFQRYRIVSDDDVRSALERTEAASKAAPPRNVVAIRPAHEAGG